MKADIFHAYQALLRQTKPSSNVNRNQDPNSIDENKTSYTSIHLVMGMTALHIGEYYEEEDGRMGDCVRKQKSRPTT